VTLPSPGVSGGPSTRWRRARTLLLALLAVALLTSACQGERVVRQPGIDVDTPQLRAIKESAGIETCTNPDHEKTDDGLPDVALPCLGGGEDVDLARLRGPMVVNLFAQWCEPCRKEMPHYQEFHQRYGDRVGVLGIDWQDTQPHGALRLAETTGVTYPLLADTEPALQAQGLPRLILLDEDGSVAYDQYVEIKSVRQLEDLVREHLGVRL
jgi:thiol-disulfide isomerase/thioredoxin